MAARCSFLSTPVALPSVPSGIAQGPRLVSLLLSGDVGVRLLSGAVYHSPSYSEFTSDVHHSRRRTRRPSEPIPSRGRHRQHGFPPQPPCHRPSDQQHTRSRMFHWQLHCEPSALPRRRNHWRLAAPVTTNATNVIIVTVFAAQPHATRIPRRRATPALAAVVTWRSRLPSLHEAHTP